MRTPMIVLAEKLNMARTIAIDTRPLQAISEG